jgi:anaphase-promoting complex subunit 11
MNEISQFKINKIRLLSTWCYNLQNNSDCTICRTNLNCNSIFAEEKGIDSYVVSGMCGHSFHIECIESWLKPTNTFSSNSHCPICSAKWIYKK